MTEPQLWVGYYQLIYLARPQYIYFGHLIGFAQSRDEFQQKVEHYKVQHQCKLSGQLAPLPALTWFQRHGHQAAVFVQTQRLKADELRFLPAQQENHSNDETSCLIEERSSVSPFTRQPVRQNGLASYLPEKLAGVPFLNN